MPLRIPDHIPPVQPAPTSIGSFRHDGLRLAYEVHGEDGPVLIMQAGLGFARLYFRPLAGTLKSVFRCVLLDSRGCGESTGPDDDAGYTVDHMAGDVLALIEHLGVERAHLYGHSLGANVIVQAALRAPERVTRLVLSSFAVATDLVLPFCRFVRGTATPEQDAVLRKYEEPGPALGPEGYADEYGLAAGAVWTPSVVRTPLTPSIAWNMGQSERAAGALWGRESAFRITGAMLQVDQRPRLHELAMPVLLLIGRYDQYAASTVPFARAVLPELEVAELTESNHHAHVEQPGRVAALVGPKADPLRPRLRLDVKLVPGDDPDAPVLEDTWTNHRLACGPIEAMVVRRLGGTRDEVTAAVATELGDDYDVESIRAAVDDLISSLSAAGLIEQGLAYEELKGRQNALRLAARAEERAARTATVVAAAIQQVPFYRERAAALGAGDATGTAIDLTQLPFTTKGDVRANFPHRLVPDGLDVKSLIASGELTVNATSGSTEDRLQVLFDPRVGALPPRYQELWDLDDDVVLEKGAIFTTPICAGFECHLGKSTKKERTRGVTLTLNSCDDPMAITDAEVRAIVGEMREHAPGVLFVNPWYAVWLARRAAALDLPLPQVPVVLSSYQYLTRRHRKLLKAAFRTSVFSYYGATDLGGALIGAECGKGSMHFREDHVHVELLPLTDVEGAGSLRNVIVTTLASPHMPLLRYEVGDVAREVPGLCSCNLGVEWGRFQLEGRKKDLVHDPRGRAITTREVDDAVGAADADFWRFVQEGPTKYLLEVMPAAGWNRDALLHRLSALFGADARIKVATVERFDPERSLKFRQTMRAG